MKHLMATASALAVIAAHPARADDVFDLGEVTVFANQTPTATNRSGSTVEIVTQQDLESTPETRVADYLSTLPGITSSANGGLGKSTTLRIRGLSDRYVSVRINGIDVSDPSSVQTSYNWGGLTTAGISRIEVLKGSQSALYGSEAIAGAINITTLRATEPGTTYSVGVEVGSYDTVRGDLSIASKAERGDIALTLSRVESDGFSAADENDGNTEKDGYEGTIALLSGGYEATDQLRLGFDLIYQNEDTNIDAFGGPGGDADRPFYTDRKGGRIYAEFDGDAIDHELALSYFETERSDPLTPFGSPTFVGDRTELLYTGRAFVGGTGLVFGGSYSEETADFGTGTASYEIFSLFGEAQFELSDTLDLATSFRVDDHSEYGTKPTARAALAWRPAAGTIVRASIGTGFRAPSLNELFGPFNFGPTDPDLEPEESRSAELGIEQALAGGTVLKATAFYTEIDNLISYPVNQYEQIPGTSVSKGVELAADVPLSEGINLFANYTYTDARDQNNARLSRVPYHDFVLGLNAQIGDRMSGVITLNRVVDRLDGFPSGPVSDYTLVNAGLSYSLTDAATAYVRIENLLDEEYQTSAGFGTSDRAFYFGVRATF